MTQRKPREIAIRVLLDRDRGRDYVENLLDAELAVAPLSSADRGLAQELTYGIVRWQAALDALIVRKTDGRPQKSILQNLLRLGLYQLFWLDRIPPHAAVHETVELAKQLGCGPQAGFLNAVLRACERERGALRAQLNDWRTSQPHLGWSHPEWLVERWRARWGEEKLQRLLELNNTPPRTFARVNTLKTDAGKLLERWRTENVEYDFARGDWLPESFAFELKQHPPLARLGSFQDGWFYIQDPSTLLAVSTLAPKPGETILDACAAPGGKTTHLAQLMNNQGRLVANDESPERLKLVEENCTRLGATCAELSATPHSALRTPHSFDRILLDAPCSNTGVLRRRVDLRWRIRPEEITRLAKTQCELLQQVSPMLKPGGTLVYSTCSLEPEENSEVVNAFLSAHPNYTLESQRELLPFADGVDGAYVAKLRRTS